MASIIYTFDTHYEIYKRNRIDKEPLHIVSSDFGIPISSVGNMKNRFEKWLSIPLLLSAFMETQGFDAEELADVMVEEEHTVTNHLNDTERMEDVTSIFNLFEQDRDTLKILIEENFEVSFPDKDPETEPKADDQQSNVDNPTESVNKDSNVDNQSIQKQINTAFKGGIQLGIQLAEKKRELQDKRYQIEELQHDIIDLERILEKLNLDTQRYELKA